MARLILPKQFTIGPYPETPVAAHAADLVFTATGPDFADGFGFAMSCRDLLIVRNATGADRTLTIQSVPAGGRLGDLAYTIANGEYAVFFFPALSGWMQDDGMLHGVAASVDLQLAVVTLIDRPLRLSTFNTLEFDAPFHSGLITVL